MKPDYTDVKSKYYGIGKGRTYQKAGALRDQMETKPNPPLVPQPKNLVTLQEEMDATSQIGLEVRTILGENLQSALFGVGVGMDRHKSRATSCACFCYKTDEQVDSMSLEDAKAYGKQCRYMWFDLLHHEGEGKGEVCEDFYYNLIIVK